MSGAAAEAEGTAAETVAPGRGLTGEEAQRRLAAAGPNVIEQGARVSVFRLLARRLANPLVVVLLVAAAISAGTGELASFVIIAAIIVVSMVLDVAHERSAGDAAESLRARVALTVHVVRDGLPGELPASGLVPGDVVLLSAGDLVPADCRLIEGRDLFVNEALLTGESAPVEKRLATGIGPDAARLWMGSSVVSGSGHVLVEATGKRTQLGGIAATLHREPPPTAFALSLHEFAVMVVRLTVLLTLVTLLGNLLLGRPVLESFLFALALAVGLTPELLPMIVTVTLAHGARRMSGKNVIVKRLAAITDLGSMDVLCSDKTGTLTEARIRLVRHVDPGGQPSAEVLRLAYLNSAFETGLRSPLDTAIIEQGPLDTAQWRKIDEVPFDFERRRVSVLVEGAGRRLLIVKGAPEDILALASHAPSSADQEPVPFDADRRAAAVATFEAISREGLRALAVAWREVANDCNHAQVDDETDLVFGGFLAFIDPPKASAAAALHQLAALGVRTKVLTGDNEHVTRHVCRQLGLAADEVLTGAQVAEMSDEALLGSIERIDLFCRMKPAQKERIIRLLRRRGHVVGYLGDGINDAPALHAADVGLSVDGAVDVAREAATMILLRHELDVIVDGVREGRRTMVNIVKYVMMASSSNLGNMVSMAASVVLLPFLPMLPVQILLNNLLYDLSQMAIPVDRVDDAALVRPARWDMHRIRRIMLTFGPLSSIFDFVTFAVLLWGFAATDGLFQTGWFIESLATQALVILVIRTRDLPWRSRPHPALLASALCVPMIAAALPFTPVGPLLGLVEPPATLLAALAAIAAAYLVVVQLAKGLVLRREGPAQ